MKPIELTQDHKDKLLEMVKRLFPEYLIHEDVNERIFISTFDRSSSGASIHWFEFCMTWLADKIYYPNNASQRNTQQNLEYFLFQTFIDSVEGINSGYTHPIDYLYTQFQKLN